MGFIYGIPALNQKQKQNKTKTNKKKTCKRNKYALIYEGSYGHFY